MYIRILNYCTQKEILSYKMELEKFARQLRLMVILTQNRTTTIEDVSKTLNMSKRSIYRYIDAFKNMGFVVEKQGTRYRLDHSSPFFKSIVDQVQFNEAEALTISRVLNAIYDNSPEVRHLREKLARMYDTEVLSRHGVDNHMAMNIHQIFQAIREQRVVIFRNYHSGSSGKVSNRIVEPYMFMNQNSEVRCYELTSNTNKTFKVARIEAIEQLDLLWSHSSDHSPFFNDLFGFSGESRVPVSLLLDQLATSVLLEEYPDAERQLTKQADGWNRLDTEVCSYLGIGRFVLGLYDNIEVIDSPEFAQYINKRLTAMYTQSQKKLSDNLKKESN